LIRLDSGSIISGVVAPALREIEADPTRALLVHSLQIGGADARIDHHDGPRRRSERSDRVERWGILGTVGGGLHDDVAAGAMRFWNCR
jgi:hypothetical protein